MIPLRALTRGLTGFFFTLNYLLLTLKNLTRMTQEGPRAVLYAGG